MPWLAWGVAWAFALAFGGAAPVRVLSVTVLWSYAALTSSAVQGVWAVPLPAQVLEFGLPLAVLVHSLWRRFGRRDGTHLDAWIS